MKPKTTDPLSQVADLAFDVIRSKTAASAAATAGNAAVSLNDAADAQGRVYGGETPEDRSTRRREQFLDAGLELIGTSGYRAASVRALCRNAKLTDRYFYESFETVEDVLVGVYQREHQRLTQSVFRALPEIKPGMSVGEVARPALRAFFEAARNPMVARILWFEVLGVSDRVNRMYRDTTFDYGTVLLSVIRSLYPTPPLSPEKEGLLAMAIIGAISQTTMGWIVAEFKTPVEDLVDIIMLLLDGLVFRLGLNAPAAPA